MSEKVRPHINILLADDDQDDRYFFNLALQELPFDTMLSTVDNGEKLLAHLERTKHELPDVLFLDLTMPRKNGAECLLELQLNDDFKELPVIIYSTSLHEKIADQLYKNGAYYYILKRDFLELREVLTYVFTMLVEKKFFRPTRDNLILKGNINQDV